MEKMIKVWKLSADYEAGAYDSLITPRQNSCLMTLRSPIKAEDKQLVIIPN